MAAPAVAGSEAIHWEVNTEGVEHRIGSHLERGELGVPLEA
jgi:hypothetical protein